MGKQNVGLVQLTLGSTVLVRPTRSAVPIKDESPKERWGSRLRLPIRTRLLQEAHTYMCSLKGDVDGKLSMRAVLPVLRVKTWDSGRRKFGNKETFRRR